MKIVDLFHYKNSRSVHRCEDLRPRAISDMEDCINMDDTAGYCIMSWDKNMDMNITWHITDDTPIKVSDISCICKILQKQLEDLS